MRRTWVALIGAVAAGLLSGGTLRAQPPVPGGIGASPARPPAYSPYLNLLRGGSPTLNYFGLVRPEVQFRQSIQNLSNQVALNQENIGNLETGLGRFSATGHQTYFMNYGGYFMSGGGGMGGGSQYGRSTVNFNRPGGGSFGGAGGATPPRR